MTTSLHDALHSTLEEAPGSLLSAQLMEELFCEVIEQIEAPKRGALSQLADATANLARQFFSRAKREPVTWQLWYAGQLQGIAGLLSVMVSQQLALETTAALRGRKHVRTILSELKKGDSRVSDLAKATGIDESQLGREIKVLARHSLVETVKEGRERWVRITGSGRTALSETLESVLAATEASGSSTRRWISRGIRKEDSRLVGATFSSVNPSSLKEESKKLPVMMLAESPLKEAAA